MNRQEKILRSSAEFRLAPMIDDSLLSLRLLVRAPPSDLNANQAPSKDDPIKNKNLKLKIIDNEKSGLESLCQFMAALGSTSIFCPLRGQPT